MLAETVNALFLSLSMNVTADCSWDNPGADKYLGDVAKAVQHYHDIPPVSRNILQHKIEHYQYDEIVEITRDSISGSLNEYVNIRDMHFGKNKVCREITRHTWPLSKIEYGMVYCSNNYCAIVPTVCGNVSRITQRIASPTPNVPAPGLKENDRLLVSEPNTLFLVAFAIVLLCVISKYR